jgi:hypothetical protein
MTALIALINKNAVALAADSAITSTKIHNSANKLFTLSKFEPVGVMIYGAAEFMGVPWETAIKMYREQLGDQTFAELRDYAEDLLKYLQTEELIVPATRQKTVMEDIFRAVLRDLRAKIVDSVSQRTKSDPTGLTESQVPDLVQQEVAEWAYALSKHERIAGISEAGEGSLIAENSARIQELATGIFEQLPFSHVIEDIVRTCCYRITRDYWIAHSGLVFAGFGKRDVFPVVRSYRVECVFSGHLRYRFDEHLSNDVNISASASIIPFAQVDVVLRFVKGIDDSYRNQYSAHLRTLLCETYPDTILAAANIEDEEQRRGAKAELITMGRNAIQQFNSSWGDFENNTFVQPVVNVISELPIQDLANIAESLVSLTSLQRKISNVNETVGGPIDVAVISKGDGFVWIKRKHYFEKDLNPGFFGNYLRARQESENRS